MTITDENEPYRLALLMRNPTIMKQAAPQIVVRLRLYRLTRIITRAIKVRRESVLTEGTGDVLKSTNKKGNTVNKDFKEILIQT